MDSFDIYKITYPYASAGGGKMSLCVGQEMNSGRIRITDIVMDSNYYELFGVVAYQIIGTTDKTEEKKVLRMIIDQPCELIFNT